MSLSIGGPPVGIRAPFGVIGAAFPHDPSMHDAGPPGNRENATRPPCAFDLMS
jgi:hypothetical protein